MGMSVEVHFSFTAFVPKWCVLEAVPSSLPEVELHVSVIVHLQV